MNGLNQLFPQVGNLNQKLNSPSDAIPKFKSDDNLSNDVSFKDTFSEEMRTQQRRDDVSSDDRLDRSRENKAVDKVSEKSADNNTDKKSISEKSADGNVDRKSASKESEKSKEVSNKSVSSQSKEHTLSDKDLASIKAGLSELLVLLGQQMGQANAKVDLKDLKVKVEQVLQTLNLQSSGKSVMAGLKQAGFSAFGGKDIKDIQASLKDVMSLLMAVGQDKNVSTEVRANVNKLVDSIQGKLEKHDKVESSTGGVSITDASSLDVKQVGVTRAMKDDGRENTNHFSRESFQGDVKKDEGQASNGNNLLKVTSFSKEMITNLDKNTNAIDHRLILSKLSHQIKSTHLLNQDKMVMKLFPEHLGQVTVHMDKKGDQMMVRMVVDSVIVKDIVDSKMSQLKTQLSDANINLTEVNVSLRGDGQNQSQGDRDRNNPLGGIGWNANAKESGVNVQSLDVFEHGQSTMRKNYNGLLDLIA